jgi:hypothetical protein
MLDASLKWSFFSRNKKNEIISLESNLSWHNENKGLYMINSQHKNETNYDDLLLKFAKELIEGDVETEDFKIEDKATPEP